uniref:Thionin-like protein 2 n=1 Tax=Cajanus cajan TaxID=3821 RepID=A0A151TNE4_CAJCA|nr:hypothetical protein KK1_022182 [Cajanus cajan]
MARNEMKIMGVPILVLIMLNLAEADYNPSLVKVVPNIVFNKLTCPAQCGVDCLLSILGYPVCFAICVAKCPKTSIDVDNCIATCGINKSIIINIDARGDVVSMVDSCLQKCQRK